MHLRRDANMVQEVENRVVIARVVRKVPSETLEDDVQRRASKQVRWCAPEYFVAEKARFELLIFLLPVIVFLSRHCVAQLMFIWTNRHVARPSVDGNSP